MLDAYYKTIRSLLIVNCSGMQSKPFDRLMSRVDSDRDGFTRSTLSSTSSASSNDSPRSSRRPSLTLAQSLRSSDSLLGEDQSTNSVLFSFGVGFKGVVGDYYEHPENFTLPSEGNRTGYQSACPDRAIGYLLLWSTEASSKKENAEEYGTDLPEVNEDEELPLADDLITDASPL